jgi:hypothetical protein
MTMRRSRVLACAAKIAALVTVMAACGIQADDSARIIMENDRRDLSAPVAIDEGPLGGNTRIYLLSNTQTGTRSQLRGVNRDVNPSPVGALEALVGGPSASEQSLQLRSALPEGTRVLTARFVAPGLVAADVSSTLFEATGDELIDAMAQIVFTLSALDGVSRVQVLVEGETKQLPRGDGRLVAGSLSVFDFPERLASSQPHYPAVPSPPVTQPKNT